MTKQELPWERQQVAMIIAILNGRVVKVDTVKVVNVRTSDDINDK